MFYIGSEGDKYHLNFWGGDEFGDGTNGVIEENVGVDQWHHIVASFDGEQSYGFVDARLQKQGRPDSPPNTDSTGGQDVEFQEDAGDNMARMYFGYHQQGSWGPSYGPSTVDEVAIFDVLLGQNEIGQIYNDGLGSTLGG